MATKIRLKRLGRRNRPFFRMVVMDERKHRDSAAIEELGWYDPREKNHDKKLFINEERVLHWLGTGAQTSETAHNLLKKIGLTYRWHLIRQGMESAAVEKEMKKWALEHEENKQKKSAKSKPEATAQAEETQTTPETSLSEPTVKTTTIETQAATTESVANEQVNETASAETQATASYAEQIETSAVEEAIIEEKNSTEPKAKSAKKTTAKKAK